jgi:hypothetical protein
MLGALKGSARKEVEAMLKDIAERGDEALPKRSRARAEAAE